MNQRRTCDASALVALLTDASEVGDWCRESFVNTALAAPGIASFETANVIRRQETAGLLDATAAMTAHRSLNRLPIEWWEYRRLADRVWSLRHDLTVYDASYVALAELLDAPLVTLDRRLARAPGIQCEVLTPPT